MAHSVQEYRGKSVVLNDLDIIALVEVGLTSQTESPRNLAETWAAQIDSSGAGCIDLKLDEFPEETLLSFFGDARRTVEAMGERALISVSNKYGMGVSFNGYRVELILQTLDELEGTIRNN